MKIQSVSLNNRKKAFQVKMSKQTFQLPYFCWQRMKHCG